MFQHGIGIVRHIHLCNSHSNEVCFLYYTRHSAWTCHVQMRYNVFLVIHQFCWVKKVKCNNDVKDMWLYVVLLNETYSIKYMFVVMVYQRKFELGITLLQALPFWIYQKPMNWPFLCHIFKTCQKEIQFIYKQLLYLRKSGKFIGFFYCCFHWFTFSVKL